MDFFVLIETLKKRMVHDLPGESAQYLMAPKHRPRTDFYARNKIEPRKGSVLILLYPSDGETCVALTLRNEYDGVHSRQVSFPGGKLEESDGTLEYTALRESKEEIGVDFNKVEIIGKLTDLYIPPSNFLVSPYLAYTNSRPEFVLDSREVAALIEVPVVQFLDEKIKTRKKNQTGSGTEIDVPCYVVNDKIIWGATAMMISEFAELLRQVLAE